MDLERLRHVLKFCLCVAMAAAGSAAHAAGAPKDVVLKGDAECTECHDEADGPELLAIGKTRHGTWADARIPTCTSCHGASKEHARSKDSNNRPKPDVTFGARTKVSAEARTAACQECHRADPKQSHWDGSIHQSRDVACSSCHRIHVAKDPVRDKRTQSDVCFACHKQQRAQIAKPSHHPLPEGKMGCSDCHNAHGSPGPKLMKRASVVETCYACHMEKRGPFVRNHQPVNEDCSICHDSHGTTTESLLKARAPFLCHTCHAPHTPIQPGVRTGAAPALPAAGWWDPSVITQGKSCLNCHAQIHGSNNPGFFNPNPQRLFR